MTSSWSVDKLEFDFMMDRIRQVQFLTCSERQNAMQVFTFQYVNGTLCG